MKKKQRFLLRTVLLVVTAVLLFACPDGEKTDEGDGKKVKAGFIYVGPVGDYGWSHAHDLGRQFVDDKFDWLETVYIEDVDEGDAIRFIDRFIQEQKCDVVFTTSFGFMDSTLEAAKKYPDTTFFHCSGFKRAENLGTYFIDFYQIYYLNGLMAGALTQTNKTGYVGAFPIPEVLRHIDAFALGLKEANPAAVVDVRWINAWYDPTAAREAAESLIASGVDTLAFTEDSPAVVETGQSHMEKGNKVFTFSHYSPMQQYGPDSVVSGQLVDWGIQYEKILTDYYEKKVEDFSDYDLWWAMKEDAAILGGNFEEKINPKFTEALKNTDIVSAEGQTMSAYDLVMKRREEMKQDPVGFDPFTGPIFDKEGNVVVDEGVTPGVGFLTSIDFYVDNVVADIPK